MLVKLSVAGLVLFVPMSGIAAEIRQRPYSYYHEVARAQEADTFVVCSGCPDDRFSADSATPKLAARLSMSESRPLRMPVHESAETEKTIPEKRRVSCLVGMVHFRFDSAEITHEERSRLDDIIRKIPSDIVVNLGGYTCDLGKDSHNMSLSLRRAREVASYLRGKGVSVRKVEGLGQQNPVSDDRRLNRRVEIVTQK